MKPSNITLVSLIALCSFHMTNTQMQRYAFEHLEGDLKLSRVKVIPGIIDHTQIPDYVHMLNRRINCEFCQYPKTGQSTSRIPRVLLAEDQLAYVDERQHLTIEAQSDKDGSQFPDGIDTLVIDKETTEGSSLLLENSWLPGNNSAETNMAAAIMPASSPTASHILPTVALYEENRTQFSTPPRPTPAQSSLNKVGTMQFKPRPLQGPQHVMNTIKSTMSTFFQSLLAAARQAAVLIQDGMQRFVTLMSKKESQ